MARRVISKQLCLNFSLPFSAQIGINIQVGRGGDFCVDPGVSVSRLECSFPSPATAWAASLRDIYGEGMRGL